MNMDLQSRLNPIYTVASATLLYPLPRTQFLEVWRERGCFELGPLCTEYANNDVVRRAACDASLSWEWPCTTTGVWQHGEQIGLHRFFLTERRLLDPHREKTIRHVLPSLFHLALSASGRAGALPRACFGILGFPRAW